MSFPRMAEIVPEGERPTASIDHFQVSEREADLSKLRAAITGGRDGAVSVGTYARLTVNDQLMMTDTPMEHDSNREVLWQSRGDVLIAGLGLGMITHAIAAKEAVRSVTVLENNADVIELVAATVPDNVEVIAADVFEWKPPRGSRWDVIYFDIWPTICADNLDDMRRLHAKYRRRKRPGGWMDSWEREALRGGWR